LEASMLTDSASEIGRLLMIEPKVLEEGVLISAQEGVTSQ